MINLLSRVTSLFAADDNTPEKGDLVNIKGCPGILYMVSDVVADDNLCRVVSLNGEDAKIVPDWQITTNYSLSCR